MDHGLILSRSHWQVMLEHVDRQAPLEACGLLAGKQDRVETVIAVQNQAQSELRFIMEPYEQLQAFHWIDLNGLELLGIFHSHPAGPDHPSATDIAEAAYDVVHLIWSRPQGPWQVNGFWIKDGLTMEVPLKILD